LRRETTRESDPVSGGGLQLVLFGFFIAPSLWVLEVPADNVMSRIVPQRKSSGAL
jgi:hypothetical protein